MSTDEKEQIDPKLLDFLEEAYKTSKSVIIDTERMEKTSTELLDAEDEIVPVEEVVHDVSEYVKRELDNNNSVLTQQINPFLCSSIPSFLFEAFDRKSAVLAMTHPFIKALVSSAVMHGFLMNQVLTDEDNGYNIESSIEPITEDELEALKKSSMVQDLAASAAVTGDLEEMIGTMAKERGDSGEFGGYSFDDEEGGEE